MRLSVRHLGQSDDIIFKFEHNQNPPKKILVKSNPVYIYICSPQELTNVNAKESRRVFKKRLKNKEPNALVVIAFNFEDIYHESIEACLNEIIKQKLKKPTYFVFLDAPAVSPTSNNQARDRFAQLEARGYNVLGEIRRIDDNRLQRGQEFSKYIKRTLRL